MELSYFIITLLIGLIIGFVIAWLYSKSKNQNAGITKSEADELKNKIDSLSIEKGKVEERYNSLEENYQTTSNELNKEREKIIEQTKELSTITADYKNLQEKLDRTKR